MNLQFCLILLENIKIFIPFAGYNLDFDLELESAIAVIYRHDVIIATLPNRHEP